MAPKVELNHAAGKVGASPKRFRKRFLLLGLAFALVLPTFRPAFHLAKTAWTDVNELAPPQKGYVDDASRLNQTPVAEVWEIPHDTDAAEKQLAALLKRAEVEHLKVSITGARHTMGGHTI